MIAYRPKHLFQKNAEDRKAWQELASNPVLHRAISATQSELAFVGYGPHEMAGVNGFIIMLLNLSENDPEQKPLPVKSLKSYDQQTVAETTK